jgi:hypothetical protein
MKPILLSLALALGLGACHNCPPPPPPLDLTCSTPRDLAPPADLVQPDMSSPDLAPPPDLCVACNAWLNPCTALGLYCWPARGCCDSNPH